MRENAELVNLETLSGQENMDKDFLLFEHACSSKVKMPVLRFYEWYPACVSLGRNQKESSINVDYCKKNSIDIVRRITGGRALLHQNELTYSFICSVDFLDSENVQKSYEIISQSLVKGFKKLGIETDFGAKKPDTKYNYCMLLSTGADLNYNGRKIAGSAQYRANGYILQHGSIIFSLNENHIKNIFGEEVEDKLVTLNEITPKITDFELMAALKSGFEENFNVNFV